MNRDPRRLRLILTVLVLISFTLITIDFKAGKSGPLGAVRRVVTAVFDPIGSGLGHLFHPVGHFFSDLGHAHSNGNKVRSLEQQLAALQARDGQTADVARQHAELQQLETLSAGRSFGIEVAQVVGLGDASGFDNTITLNIGSADGVVPAMTVIAGSTSGGGLVGRVLTTTAHTATVAVIIDPNVLVGARLRSNADLGTISGHGQAPLTFTPTGNAATAVPVKGDVVETYGSDTYAAGIPIGTVQSVAPTKGATTVTASVVPFIDYTSLEVVGVVVQPSSKNPVAPIVPTATVTATVTVTAPPPSTPASAPVGATSSRAGG